MKIQKIALSALLCVCGAGASVAGGIDRSGQGIGILFETGNVAELSFGRVNPTVSGVGALVTAGVNSGDMSDNYSALGLGYKQQVTDALSFALIFDQPFGASTDYPVGTGYYAAGWTAEFESRALTALARYSLGNGLSVHGGIAYQTVSADIALPNVGGAGVNYAATGARTDGVGAVAGFAYEKPEIALRVALTWRSAIDHDIATTETLTGLGPARTSTTSISTPQSVNLDFQTGVAQNTLLFASARWVEWSAFAITPAVYTTSVSPGNSIVSYDDDTISYNIGLGRKFNDRWSASVSIGYEAANGGSSSNLGPTDGNRSIALGAQYTDGPLKVSAGVRYVKVGNTFTALGAASPAANFTDNDAVAFGLKLSYSF